MARQLELYSLSNLEKGRIREAKSDLTALSPFLELEGMITSSLMPQEFQTSQTDAHGKMKLPSRNPLLSRRSPRPFQDSALVERLIRDRSQIPVSSRIIRNQDS
ncbi:MAG: hypothetical protein EBX52_10915 [Proteobacteria bacterium]|nr:hypothetical protein [Pseudomonadota bacterium]